MRKKRLFTKSSRHVRSAGKIIVALTAMFSGGAVQAQSSVDYEQKYVTLLGIPSATTAPKGLGFVQVSTQLYGPGGVNDTGTSFAAGFGMGNPNGGVGLQFTALANSPTDVFDNYGYFNIKASHRLSFADQPTYIGLQIDRLAGWGDASGIEPSAAVMLTTFSTLDIASQGKSYPVMMSFGLGTNARNSNQDPGVYLGAGIGVSKNVGLSAAWSGDQVNLGAAFRFENQKNLGMHMILSDAFDQQAGPQLDLAVSWIFDKTRGR